MAKKLAKLFEKNGLFSRQQLKDLRKKAKREDRFLSQILLENKTQSQDDVLDVLAEFFGIQRVELNKKVIAASVLNLIPKELAEQHSVIIFKKIKDIIHVAMSAPEDKQTLNFIKNKTGLEPKIFICTPEEIHTALQRYDSEISDEFAKIIQASTEEALETHASAEKMAQYVPIIKMVNDIIERALLHNASDIHVEPQTNKIIVRFRIDGLLKPMVELPKEILPALVTRVKIMANLKIDEHRIPQDGRFQFGHNGNQVAIRVSVIPTLYGSKVALRLLESEEKQFTLRKLGLNRNDFAVMKDQIKSSQGIILVTGPTGSGKTTTLYTLLRMLNNDKVNICTVEDPIEYGIAGINQTQINPRAGLTFANGLRSLLRQDPNILMVGEVRDTETADMSINAAMTGHLVLSTLHTNNAFLAPQRLVEMNLQPYLISSVLNMIIGQRLVRKICRYCRTPIRAKDKLFAAFQSAFDIKGAFNKFKKLNLLPADANLDSLVFYQGRGCAKCGQTGYQGRIGIYELVKVDERFKGQVLSDYSETAIKKTALANGALTMAEDGLLKVFLGRTTFDEIMRVTKE